MITYNNPEYLWLLLLLVPMVVWYVLKLRNIEPALQMSTVQQFKHIPVSRKPLLRHLLFALRCVAIALIVIAIARPQTSDSLRNESTEGIDIMISLDISGTMLAADLKPDRLNAAKNVAIEFVSDRPDDNIGLVVFAGESFTQCPLTIDHAALINLINSVEYGIIEDGTAVGLGLATAINRIKDSQAKSKVIILLTDGTNNRGDIAPVTAAEIAKTFGIRVYTIGVGKHGLAPYPFQTPFGVQYQDIEVDIDEKTLQQIADITGGSYFRAVDTDGLRAIYSEIDQMEKTKLNVKEYSKKQEEYPIFLLVAFLLIAIELIIRHTILRTLP